MRSEISAHSTRHVWSFLLTLQRRVNLTSCVLDEASWADELWQMMSLVHWGLRTRHPLICYSRLTPRRFTRRQTERATHSGGLVEIICINGQHWPKLNNLHEVISAQDSHILGLQERNLQDRYAQLLSTTVDLPMSRFRCAVHITFSTNYSTTGTPTGGIMSRVRTVEMDETILSIIGWNQTKPHGHWELAWESEPRAGAKMSLYCQNWRILQIILATITAVLTQGKWPGSDRLRVLWWMSTRCHSEMN